MQGDDAIQVAGQKFPEYKMIGLLMPYVFGEKLICAANAILRGNYIRAASDGV